MKCFEGILAQTSVRTVITSQRHFAGGYTQTLIQTRYKSAYSLIIISNFPKIFSIISLSVKLVDIIILE